MRGNMMFVEVKNNTVELRQGLESYAIEVNGKIVSSFHMPNGGKRDFVIIMAKREFELVKRVLENAK